MEQTEDKVGHKPMTWSERIYFGLALVVVAVILAGIVYLICYSAIVLLLVVPLITIAMKQ
ncbi:MAG: hypothetical protein IJ998_05830 [Alistipes sp.]|nr:hypothetical protein [Alistipes sp.]